MDFKKFLNVALIAGFASVSLASCSDDDDNDNGNGSGNVTENSTLLVVNNGSYGVPNASLTVYDPKSQQVLDNAFSAVNGIDLGEIAQSATVCDDDVYVCVNLSNVVYKLDSETLKIENKITDVSSPRYALEIPDADKIYVSQMNTDQIAVISEDTYKPVGTITVPNANGGTEQLLLHGNYVYTNCWSYGTQIAKIDTRTDRVVATLTTGLQPKAMVIDDVKGLLWVLCDGGSWAQNPIGYEEPSLVAVDLATFTIKNTVKLPYSSVSCLNYYNGYLYWLQDNLVERMSLTSTTPEAFITTESYALYALTVNPVNGDIYIGDAIDYWNNGVVYRYGINGIKVDQFTAGIIPANFAWIEMPISAK